MPTIHLVFNRDDLSQFWAVQDATDDFAAWETVRKEHPEIGEYPPEPNDTYDLVDATVIEGPRQIQITQTGCVFVESPHRMAGTWQIAYDVVTPTGKTGVALFYYEYDKRDVMAERLDATPEIAAELREYIGGESPSVWGSFCFPGSEDRNKNGNAVTDAVHAVSESVYCFDG